MGRKIFIFGLNSEVQTIQADLKEEVELLGYLDNNRDKQGVYVEGKAVFAPEEIRGRAYDYIIISLLKNVDQVKAQLTWLGVPKAHVISFFYPDGKEREEGEKILDPIAWRQDMGWIRTRFEFECYKHQTELRRKNAIYEMADYLRKGGFCFPVIADADQIIHKIIRERCSLCRFGDGEFEMMRGNVRPLFQKPDKVLAGRLKEVFRSNQEKILIAIPDQFGTLEQYTDQAADGIREYMDRETRLYLNGIMDDRRTYYDAYISRPYLIYKDKENAGKRFQRLKQIWKDSNVVIIEGSETRMGVGNDLLDNAASVKRIIGPSENAFDKYHELFEAASAMERDCLFLLLLGPAATVMAYDLAMAGYQAVDIGHVDIEYEWFLRGVEDRVDIPGKYVNEVWGGQKAQPCKDRLYRSQIVYDCTGGF